MRATLNYMNYGKFRLGWTIACAFATYSSGKLAAQEATGQLALSSATGAAAADAGRRTHFTNAEFLCDVFHLRAANCEDAIELGGEPDANTFFLALRAQQNARQKSSNSANPTRPFGRENFANAALDMLSKAFFDAATEVVESGKLFRKTGAEAACISKIANLLKPTLGLSTDGATTFDLDNKGPGQPLKESLIGLARELARVNTVLPKEFDLKSAVELSGELHFADSILDDRRHAQLVDTSNLPKDFARGMEKATQNWGDVFRVSPNSDIAKRVFRENLRTSKRLMDYVAGSGEESRVNDIQGAIQYFEAVNFKSLNPCELTDIFVRMLGDVVRSKNPLAGLARLAEENAALLARECFATRAGVPGMSPLGDLLAVFFFRIRNGNRPMGLLNLAMLAIVENKNIVVANEDDGKLYIFFPSGAHLVTSSDRGFVAGDSELIGDKAWFYGYGDGRFNALVRAQ
ncbi:MAG: hypothetical protein LBI39_03820 [Puniceicoccales bacterium]|nr:hypothetical protein [Puniceicoccales bacterium]